MLQNKVLEYNGYSLPPLIRQNIENNSLSDAETTLENIKKNGESVIRNIHSGGLTLHRENAEKLGGDTLVRVLALSQEELALIPPTDQGRVKARL